MVSKKKNVPPYWKAAKAHLAKSDKVMAKIVASYGGELLVSRGDPFNTLARAIVGQQISVKAADSIWKRLEQGLKSVVPLAVLSMNEEALRSHGLSRSKVLYLKSLAEHFHARPDGFSWEAMQDEEIIRNLTSIKGIGRWTAEMFLIFHLMRPDVLPVADLGLQKAIELHYNKGRKMELKKLRKIADAWRPYRSVATWYLWRSLDPVPVEY